MKNNKNKYELASATKRIIARSLDMFFLVLISIGIFCALTLSIIINNHDKYNQPLFVGMLLLSFLISFIIFFIYFIVIPYFFKGYTLFKKIFKIKTHNTFQNKSFFINLIKKELFLWMFLFLVNIIFVIILFFYKDPLSIINKLFLFDFKFNKNQIFIPIFQFLNILFFLPITIIVIHLAINSKKKALHDYFSDTCVINTIPIETNNEVGKDKVNFEMPGIIDSEVLKELEND